jgi:purine-nucleoside phosphorylase
MLQLAKQIESAAQAVEDRWDTTPCAGIILGSGLGGLADEMDVEQVIDYADIPHFPQVTAMGHRGRLVCGGLAGRPVVAFQGRFHLYEGHSPQQSTLPVRLIKALGANTMLVSNAAGGINPKFKVGDVMLIHDQINLTFRNPLVGINDDELGPRFPDMSEPYDPQLEKLAIEIARQQNFVLHRGVYVALLGPTYETRAEYRMARLLGGDAVGMSTVPEVVVARHAGMRVLGLSTITNIADSSTETTGHDVLNAAASASNKLSKIIEGVVKSLPQ